MDAPSRPIFLNTYAWIAIIITFGNLVWFLFSHQSAETFAGDKLAVFLIAAIFALIGLRNKNKMGTVGKTICWLIFILALIPFVLSMLGVLLLFLFVLNGGAGGP